MAPGSCGTSCNPFYVSMLLTHTHTLLTQACQNVQCRRWSSETAPYRGHRGYTLFDTFSPGQMVDVFLLLFPDKFKRCIHSLACILTARVARPTVESVTTMVCHAKLSPKSLPPARVRKKYCTWLVKMDKNSIDLWFLFLLALLQHYEHTEARLYR